MENTANRLSSPEEEFLRRADKALAVLAMHYRYVVRRQIRNLNRYVHLRQWQNAAHIAHSIGGEAGTFNYRHAGSAAIVLRDFLLLPSPETNRNAIRVAGEAVYHLVQNDIAAPEAEHLIVALRAVAQKVTNEVRA